MTKVRVHVSRHALERYLERVMGVNVEKATRRIQESGQIAFDAGASAFNIDGLNFPITSEGTIVTALPRNKVVRVQQKEISYDRRSGKRGYHGGKRPPDRRRDERRDERRGGTGRGLDEED